MFQIRYRYITKEHLTFDYIRDLLESYYARKNYFFLDKKINRDTEAALFIISSILFRIYVYKRNDNNKPLFKEWTPLHSKVLHSVIGSHYREIVDFLLDANIIESYKNCEGNESYMASYKAKLFRLTVSNLYGETAIQNFKYLKSIDTSLKKNFGEMSSVAQHMHKFLDDLYINDTFQWKEHHKPQVKIFKSQDDASLYKVDKSGRHYHKLTNLFSFGRYFVKYKGKSLVSIDCANSQPLLLLHRFKMDNNEIDKNYSLEFDTEMYRQLVTSGQFYEYIMEEYNTRENKNITRKQTKLMVYKYIFFNYRKFQHPVLDIFKEKFPNIYKIIANNQGGKDDLSFKLRQAEANLWISTIAQTIYEKFPEIPIFILHDSVFTTKEYQETVFGIVRDIFKKQYGTVKLHVNDYSIQSQSYKEDYIEYIDELNIPDADDIELKEITEHNTGYIESNYDKSLQKNKQLYYEINAPP